MSAPQLHFVMNTDGQPVACWFIAEPGKAFDAARRVVDTKLTNHKLSNCVASFEYFLATDSLRKATLWVTSVKRPATYCCYVCALVSNDQDSSTGLFDDLKKRALSEAETIRDNEDAHWNTLSVSNKKDIKIRVARRHHEERREFFEDLASTTLRSWRNGEYRDLLTEVILLLTEQVYDHQQEAFASKWEYEFRTNLLNKFEGATIVERNSFVDEAARDLHSYAKRFRPILPVLERERKCVSEDARGCFVSDDAFATLQMCIKGELSRIAHIASNPDYVFPWRSRGIPTDVKRAVRERDDNCCTVCGGSRNLEFDHIWPFSKGGNHTVENLRLLCKACHEMRDHSVLLEAGRICTMQEALDLDAKPFQELRRRQG